MSGFHLNIVHGSAIQTMFRLTPYPTSYNRASAGVSAISRLRKQSVEFMAPFATALDRACHGNACPQVRAHQPAPHQRWRVVQPTGRPSQLEEHPRRPQQDSRLLDAHPRRTERQDQGDLSQWLEGQVAIHFRMTRSAEALTLRARRSSDVCIQ